MTSEQKDRIEQIELMINQLLEDINWLKQQLKEREASNDL